MCRFMCERGSGSVNPVFVLQLSKLGPTQQEREYRNKEAYQLTLGFMIYL